ncbi:hypothetical protein B0T17DRAFT_506825 [Bombardia bombarda]|uniref:DUF7918 domain-containing protein n=1 Tax=Bombardia bombarda TaxID=252184 RepID=A0AA40C9Q3_9PEZI|nr:hypothetical protein B0T17DRAFT_506825 [Bombardia bombarda]
MWTRYSSALFILLQIRTVQPFSPQLVALIRYRVVVDGETAKEYDDPDEDRSGDIDLYTTTGQKPAYIVKYIEAKPGAPFVLKLNRSSIFQHRGDHICWYVTLDGQDTNMNQIFKTTNSAKIIKDGYTVRDRLKGYCRNYFKFAGLDIIDADQHLTTEQLKDQIAKAKSCGVIRAKLFHMRFGRRIDRNYDLGFEDAVPGLDKASEKALSLRTHPEYIIPTPTLRDKVYNMSDADARRLLAELLEERRNQAAAVKKADPSSQDGMRRIKREASPDGTLAERYKVRRLENGKEEFDLTSD